MIDALIFFGYLVVCPPLSCLRIAWLMVLWQEHQWKKRKEGD